MLVVSQSDVAGLRGRAVLCADQVEACDILLNFVDVLHDLSWCFFFLLISQRSGGGRPCVRTDKRPCESRSFLGFVRFFYRNIFWINKLHQTCVYRHEALNTPKEGVCPSVSSLCSGGLKKSFSLFQADKRQSEIYPTVSRRGAGIRACTTEVRSGE